MKARIFSPLVFLISALLFSGSAMAAFPADTTETDSTKEGFLRYKMIDVVIEYDWQVPERDYGLSAVILTKDGLPERIQFFKGERKLYEVFIIDGVVIKLYKHRTAKLLRSYGRSISV